MALQADLAEKLRVLRFLRRTESRFGLRFHEPIWTFFEDLKKRHTQDFTKYQHPRKWTLLVPFWYPFGPFLDPFGTLLEPFWDPFGALLVPFETFSTLPDSKGLLGPSWTIPDPKGSFWGPSEPFGPFRAQ